MSQLTIMAARRTANTTAFAFTNVAFTGFSLAASAYILYGICTRIKRKTGGPKWWSWKADFNWPWAVAEMERVIPQKAHFMPNILWRAQVEGG